MPIARQRTQTGIKCTALPVRYTIGLWNVYNTIYHSVLLLLLLLLLYARLSNDDNNAYLYDILRSVSSTNTYAVGIIILTIVADVYNDNNNNIYGTRTCFFIFSPRRAGFLGVRREDTTTSPPFCIAVAAGLLLCYTICNIILICRESHTSRDGKRVGFQTFSRWPEVFLSLGCF